MLKLNKTWLPGLAVAFAMVMAGAANAQVNNAMVLNPALTSSLVASPYFTDTSGVFTAILVTNVAAVDTVLHISVINGDAGEDWGEQDFFCGMTPNETTLILMTSDGASGAKIETECSNVGRQVPPFDIVNQQPGTVEDLFVDGARGIVVLTQKTTANEAVTQHVNRLIADWQVIDLAAGLSYASEAAGFQAAAAPACTGPATPVVGCLGDDAFEFGAEVSSFPTTLGADFIAPTPTGTVDVEFILITLDGREGVPPRQKLDGFYYNDDEVKRSYNDFEYECMEVKKLTDIDQNLSSDRLCDGNAPLGCVGHIVLNPDTVSVAFSQHDLAPASDGFGDNNQVRLSATIGWIVHRFAPGGDVLPGLGPIANQAANARILNQGANTLVGLGGDIIALDLR